MNDVTLTHNLTLLLVKKEEINNKYHENPQLKKKQLERITRKSLDDDSFSLQSVSHVTPLLFFHRYLSRASRQNKRMKKDA